MSASVSTASRTAKVTANASVRSAETASVPAVAAPRKAFEPIEVSQDFYVGLAFELNRSAEGIDLVPVPAPRVAPRARWVPVAVAENERVRPDVAGPVAGYGAELFDLIADQMDQVIDDSRSRRVDRSADLKVMVEAPRSVIAEAALAAETNAAAVPVPALVIAKTVGVPVDAAAGLPWPIFSPGQAVPQSATEVVRETTVPWPVFAPTNSVVGQETGTASMAEHAPADRQLPSSAPTQESGRRHAGLGQAVLLTQQAMRAWIAVLAAPAPVEVTAR